MNGRRRPLRPRGLLISGLCITAVACASYEAAPLDEAALLDELLRARERTSETTGELTLRRAVASLRTLNPAVREARAAQATAAAAAAQSTPLANPALTAGPLLLSGAGITEATRWGVEAALSWALPLFGTRGATDDLFTARARASFVRTVAVTRREWLALRGEWAALRVETARLETRGEILRATAAAAERAQSLVRAGRADAVDVALLEIEHARERANTAQQREVWNVARGRIAARTGLPLAAIELAADRPPKTPTELPAPDELREIAIREHPGLAERRAEYAVSEQNLRLAVARQYPSLLLGASYEREQGADRFGLPLGIQLPLFARNQRGIATACAQREAARERYVATLTRAINDLERARALLADRQRRVQVLRETTVPAASALVEAVRRAVEAGRFDALRYLRAAQTERQVRLELLDAERDVFAAWNALEQATGTPFLQFPDATGPIDADAGAPPRRSTP